MGAWGDEPWDNDTAADWFDSLMDDTSLRKHWRKGITADPEDEGETVLAAAWLFVQLGRVYVWPIKRYDKDLELTITKLRAIRDDERLSEGDPEGWVRRIDGYIADLESRAED
ncbi:MAG: DUF4259 domain-containing protein [Micrococcales bacterium]|nr:DUF4259 domain-containing protein [Micrococcales bacterium]